MAKVQGKKQARQERRKKPRNTKASGSTSRRAAPAKAASQKFVDECVQCGTKLRTDDRALFVEEENARTFCTESCISDYFAPDIKRLEKEYFAHLPKNDLIPEEKEKLAHLRWVALEDPDETWRERTVSGDVRYTLISEFQPSPQQRIWMICQCLMLRGEPSFLFLAFPTQSLVLMQHYRRGEKMNKERRTRGSSSTVSGGIPQAPAEESSPILMDGLADSWTAEESLRAQISHRRSVNDIPPSEFELYQACLEETLEEPDEVWSTEVSEDGQVLKARSLRGDSDTDGEDMDAVETFKIFHFIRRYTTETPETWYVIVARETETDDQIEILDAFPTRDPELVQRHRVGVREVGGEDEAQASRVVH